MVDGAGVGGGSGGGRRWEKGGRVGEEMRARLKRAEGEGLDGHLSRRPFYTPGALYPLRRTFIYYNGEQEITRGEWGAGNEGAQARIKHEAMKSAYLLPLIHLRRLAILVWRTGTLQGVSDLKSAEFEAIYTILASTLEAAPELLLQFHALARLQHTTWSEPPLTTKISLAASCISVAYNFSQAIMYTTNKKNFISRVGILAMSAVYSASAILIRSTGFVFMIELAVNFNRVYALVYVVAILVPQTITYLCDVSYLENGASILKRLFLCSAFIYMSIGLGPLYTLTSTEKKYRNCKWHVYLGGKQHCGMLARTYIPPSGDPAPNFLSCWTALISFFTAVGAFVASTLCFVLVDMYTEVAEVEEGENNRGENVIEFKEWRRLRSNSRQSSTFIYTKTHGCIL
eukprot:Gb_03716 [translate_table: standard]